MAKRSTHLPIVIDIPEPCPESWQDMAGGERQRHCARCEKQIHNLSVLSQAEIAQLVARGDVCVSLEVTQSGALVTAEPRAQEPRSAVGKVVLAAALTALAACSAEPTVGTVKRTAEPVASATPSAVVAAPSSTASADLAIPPAPSASAISASSAEPPHIAPPQRLGGTIPPQHRLMGKPVAPMPLDKSTMLK